MPQNYRVIVGNERSVSWRQSLLPMKGTVSRAMSTIEFRMLLVVNGHLRHQKFSTCNSRPAVASLYLPIKCVASLRNFLCDKALGFKALENHDVVLPTETEGFIDHHVQLCMTWCIGDIIQVQGRIGIVEIHGGGDGVVTKCHDA